ncbi:MAG: Crp/Fnr family transcriptional regulator [Synechococcaceae cyanobacterium SM2_3_1]|nr:Crp/Fnr family transcriptional regulator [Synechococcaceae cyanobacterium SM2_3_1]
MTEATLLARLSKSPLLEGVSPDSLQTLVAQAKALQSYPAGRTLLLEDAGGSVVYLLLSGWIKIRRSTPTDPLTLAVLGSPCWFGEMAVLEQSPRSGDVVSLSDVEVLPIRAPEFKQLLMREPILSFRLAQALAQRLRQTNQLFYLRQQSAAVRLLFVLVQLASIYGEPLPRGKQIMNVSQHDLADLASVTVQEATTILERLQQQKAVLINDSSGKMELLQYEKMLQATQLI